MIERSERRERKRARFSAVVAALLLPFAAVIAAAQYPLEHFFQNPHYSSLQISPDGTHIAVLTPVDGRRNVGVLRLEDRAVWAVTSLRDTDVADFFWANDDRLIFTQDSDGNESFGLYGVNRDGSRPRVLIKPGTGVTRFGLSAEVIDTLEHDSDHVLVAYNDNRLLYPDVYRMNVATGTRARVVLPPGNVTEWLTDHAGVVRVAVAEGPRAEDLVTRILYRAGESAEWETLATFEFEATRWIPLDFTADNKKLYVASNVGRDTYAVHLYDPESRTMEAELLAVDKFDVRDITLSRSTRDLISINYTDTQLRQHRADPQWAALLDSIDTALPDTLNRITTMTADEQQFIILAASDRDPGSYYLFDRESNRLEYFASRMPWIDPLTMAETRPVTYAARDGERVHGYLTLPLESDGGPVPLIVHPHGGPFGVRDTWRFNDEIQFLANRGYGVLQIDFRGSGGYGKRFMEIGYQQWGLAMQDDITDAVHWAIDEGITEPGRVCIYGASYGGYAAMVAVTQTPNLYQCAVNYVGVVDILELYDDLGTGAIFASVREWFHRAIGDPSADRDRLMATSPVNNVENIEVPVLIVHGTRDPRVPIRQANLVIRALRRADADHQVLIKRNEGHGFFKEENRLELYSVMEDFFAQHLRGAERR